MRLNSPSRQCIASVGQIEEAVVPPGMGWGGAKLPKCRLAPTVKHTGQESGRKLCFQILIVSAVKISKQCLQTASASGGLRPPRPYLWAIAVTNENSWRHHIKKVVNVCARMQT